MVNGALDFSGGNKNTIFTIKSNCSDSFVVKQEKKKVLIFDRRMETNSFTSTHL